MTTPPIAFRWDGESMVPLQRFQRLCDAEYVVGEVYTLVPHEQRSGASHRHYFAAINSAWESLPEEMAERFPTADRLRRYALIRCGYRDERSIVCASKAEARRLAAFIRPMDSYAVVAVSEAVVRVYTAQSQSLRAMDKATFQRSKQDVLDALAEMIGVEPDALASHARAA